MNLLVTGAAGFIGFHVCRALLERGDTVVGIDNLNDYYDVSLKAARLAQIEGRSGFSFVRLDLADQRGMADLFAQQRFQRVVHLGAQAGVRYGIQNPHAYAASNLSGFLHVLEGCRKTGVEHLVYASSSSVYGASTRIPFSVEHSVDHPLSLYAATKKSNELMAHSYAHLFRLSVTGLRFFTVYGPWGRPDMAPFLFVRKILAGEPIDVFNYGQHKRDFTYIDDIVEGVVRTLDKVATADPAFDLDTPSPAISSAPYRIYNIGNNAPVELMDFITSIERATGKQAIRNFLPMQPGDVPTTYANVDALAADVGFRPGTSIDVGVQRLVAWYRAFYRC